MQKVTLSVSEAQRDLIRILDIVGVEETPMVVEKDGKPLAAIVPMKLLEKWEEQRRDFFTQMHQIAERANLSNRDAVKLIDRARYKQK